MLGFFVLLHMSGLHRQIFDKTIHQILEPNAIDTLEIRRIQFCGHIYGGAIGIFNSVTKKIRLQKVNYFFLTFPDVH